MTDFIKTANTFHISPKGALDIYPHLPNGTYIVKFNPDTGKYFLEKAESFGKLPKKIYGDTKETAKRILNTYMDRESSTGVLLLGEKGSGKTMLAKFLSLIASETYEIPTLIVNSEFFGDTFNKFVQDIDQPCIIMFDEFEKIYDDESQEQLLTLLDGVFPQKKLFILTCNNKNNIDTNMHNRPGRIFYFIEYNGLDANFIEEYANDNILDKTQVVPFVNMCEAIFNCVNFDMIKAIIEEMNRYGETAKQAIKILNTKPSASGVSYSLTVSYLITGSNIKSHTHTISANILGGDKFTVYHENGIKEDGTNNDIASNIEVDLSLQEMTSISPKSGILIFEKDGYEYTLTKNKSSAFFDYMNAF